MITSRLPSRTRTATRTSRGRGAKCSSAAASGWGSRQRRPFWQTLPAIATDLSKFTDAALVLGALSGEQPAFGELVSRYQRRVINLIARVTGDPALAEDLAQETFVRAFRNLAGYEAARPFSNWLFRIAHNIAIDALRRVHLTTVPIKNEERLPAGAPVITAPADEVETAALARALESALASVRPDYRSAIVLRYQEGLSYEDIAQVMSIPAATARTYVHRARKELASLLSEAGWKPTGWV